MEPTKRVLLNGSEYVIGRLDTFQALEVVRLAAPVLPILFSGIFDGLLKLTQEKHRGEPDRPGADLDEVVTLLSVSEPLLKAVAAMPQDDFKRIVSTCLSCVEKKSGERSYRSVIANGVPFSDLGAADALMLTLHVLTREVRPFGAALFASASGKSSEVK